MKLLGALFLLLACTLYGAYSAYKLINREAKLKRLLAFIGSLTEEIRLTRAELPDIVKRLPESGNFLKEGKICGVEGLNAEDVRVLNSFVAGLGKTDLEGQINNAKLHTEALKARLDSASEERKKMSRLYVSLGFLCGSFLVVLII